MRKMFRRVKEVVLVCVFIGLVSLLLSQGALGGLAQVIHDNVTGSEDVGVWNSAYRLYRAMILNPASVGRMEIGDRELELLLQEFDTADPVDSYVRQYSVSLLGEIGSAHSQGILMSCLYDDNVEVQRLATAALGRCGDKVAAKAILSRMEALPEEEAFDALMAINDPQARDVFIEGLGSESTEVRTVSAVWLSRCSDQATVTSLVGALKEEKDGAVQDAKSWKATCIEDVFDVPGRSMNPLQAEAFSLATINDPQSIPSLLEIAASGGSLASRQGAIAALALMRAPEAVEPLVAYLNDPAEAVELRRTTALALGSLNAEPVTGALTSALADADPRIRINAALSLTQSGHAPTDFTAGLLSLADNKESSVELRASAVMALGEMKVVDAVDALIGILNGPQSETNDDLRTAAALSLGAIGDSRAVVPLGNVIVGSTTADLQRAATASLGQIENDSAVEPLTGILKSSGHSMELYSDAISSLDAIDSIGTEQILTDLVNNNGDLQFRQAAITGLADSDDPAVTQLLLDSLTDQHTVIRYAALESLGDKVVEPEVEGAFLDIMKFDQDPYMRCQAALALEGIESPKVRRALSSALDDPYPRVRQAAVSSLTPLASQPQMQKIRPLVSDLNLGVRQTAIMSLGLRSQDFPKNLAILTPMVTDTDWRVRQTAITALGSSALEYPKVKQLFLDVVADPLQPQICRQNAMLSLSQTKDLEIKSLLVSTLNSPDWRMRQVATFGLGNFKEIDLAPPLRLAIQDPYWPVRQAGVASIGGIGSATTAMPELLPLLNDPSWEVRLTTLACLNTFKEDLTTQTLLTSLKDEHPEIRCLAVSSLADRVNEIGVSQSLVDLMSHDGSPSVRSQAALSLKGISDLNSTSALVTALSDPFPRVRNSAMLSLAPIAGLDINRRMQSLVSDRNLSVSQTAILSLGLKSADFPENVDLLMPKLTDMNWQTRQIAMASLGGNISRFTQLKQPFVDVMGDESQPFSLRQTAMLSLTATGDLQMKSRLLDDLDNPDWRMRQTATLGLGSLKDMSTLPSLQRLTTDPYWGVRQSVAASLSNFGDTTVVKNLSPLLRDSNWQVRCSAAASFSSFDTTLKSKALSPLLNDSNRLVREAAARSMGTSIPTIPRTLSMDSSQGMVNYMLSDIRDWQTSAIQAEYMQRLEMKDLGNAAIAASYGIDVGRLYQSFSDASITSPLLASLRLMTKVGAQSGVEDRRADSDTANRRLTYVSLGLNVLGRSYVGIGCTALARGLNYWGTSARIQASESLWTTTNCRFSNSDGYLSMTGSMFVKTTFTPAANSGLFQGGVFHEGTTVRQSSASYTVRQGGSFSTPYQSYYVHNERNFGSGSRWTYNQFGSGLNNYGSGLNNYGSGLNNYGSGLNNYGSGLNNYGSGLNNYGSGLNNYGSGLNNYGSGLNSSYNR